MGARVRYNYYSIATCAYPSQGGGGYLFGRGTVYRQILPDFYEDEREVPKEILEEMQELRKEINKPLDFKNTKEEDYKLLEEKAKKLQQFEKDIEKYPPKGNVWELNAKQWRKRGWGDNAYPAIGLGAMVPSDWCGGGCTMMNERALDLAIFDGYEGKGTEDLYIIWNRWYPNGLKICSLPHCLCDHVVRDKTNPLKYIHCQCYHETEGECVGHLRLRYKPFYAQDIGEKFNINNEESNSLYFILIPHKFPY